MTANDALREAVEHLTEEDAARWLAQIQPEVPCAAEESAARLAELFRQWDLEDATVDDGQWEELARALDIELAPDPPVRS